MAISSDSSCGFCAAVELFIMPASVYAFEVNVMASKMCSTKCTKNYCNNTPWRKLVIWQLASVEHMCSEHLETNT